MLRNRITTNLEGVYVGPSPATGYHFIDSNGTLQNGALVVTGVGSGAVATDPTTGYSNLIYPIPRVQSFSYDINVDRTHILGLGKAGSVKRTIVNPPTVNLSFSFLNLGIIQDVRLGFYENFYDPTISGTIYPNNFGVCLISGFLTRNIGTISNSNYHWPYDYRDCRNIFVAIAQDKTDLNYRSNNNVDVLGFGNCYITSWRTSVAVGEFPKTEVSYIAETMRFDRSGTRIQAPAINTQSYSGYTGNTVSIPSGFNDVLPTVLLPKDISISISGYNSNYGFDIQNFHLQSYEIGMQFTRESLTNVGYMSPMDRTVKLPVPVTLTFEAILNSGTTGTLTSLFVRDDDYNIDITIPYSRLNSGSVYYAIRRARFNSASFTNSIGSNKIGRFNFETEIDPEDYTKGLFISGNLGVAISGFTNRGALLGFFSNTGNLLLIENGDTLALENGDTILLESSSPQF